MIKITDKPIVPDTVLDSLQARISGSIVFHAAVVRPSSEGRKVTSIDFQIDRTKGEQELSRIAADIRNNLEIEVIALCRRTGSLGLGDIILVAAVAAPHRKEAFEACQQAVERMRKMASAWSPNPSLAGMAAGGLAHPH